MAKVSVCDINTSMLRVGQARFDSRNKNNTANNRLAVHSTINMMRANPDLYSIHVVQTSVGGCFLCGRRRGATPGPDRHGNQIFNDKQTIANFPIVTQIFILFPLFSLTMNQRTFTPLLSAFATLPTFPKHSGEYFSASFFFVEVICLHDAAQ